MSSNALRKTNLKFLVLQVVISIITIQNIANAQDISQRVSEELRLQGYEQQEKGNLVEALSFYQKAVSLGLENAAVFNDIGVIYEQMGNQAKAEQAYIKAIQTDSEYTASYMNLAYLYKSIGYKEKAFKNFRIRYEMGDPLDAWTQKAKEELLAIKPEYEMWIKSREADFLNRQITEDRHNEFIAKVERATQYFERGRTLANQNEYELAVTEFNKALALMPDNQSIVEARKKAIIEISKRNVQERSEQVIKLLNAGDSFSARKEIEKMLATIPNESLH